MTFKPKGFPRVNSIGRQSQLHCGLGRQQRGHSEKGAEHQQEAGGDRGARGPPRVTLLASPVACSRRASPATHPYQENSRLLGSQIMYWNDGSVNTARNRAEPGGKPSGQASSGMMFIALVPTGKERR